MKTHTPADTVVRALQNILLPLPSLLFGTVATVRGKLFDWGVLPSREFDLPVICVGNLAVGGTGKTPHVEYILRILHENGYRTAMLSRGYGRRTKGFVAATPQSTASEIGDEPLQMLHNCPFAHVAVCEKRVEGMERLLALWPETDVVVLDDAYQHRHIKAGFNILLTDAHRLYSHDHFLPWGRLRESARAARRAQMVVVTKCGEGERPSLAIDHGQQLFYSHIEYAPLRAFDETENKSEQTSYEGKGVALITGIANPLPLRSHIEAQGARHIASLAFPDHHDFSAADCARINRFVEDNADCIPVTTQKDAMRLKLVADSLSPTLRRRLQVQPITVKVEAATHEQESFNQTILKYVSENTRNRRMD